MKKIRLNLIFCCQIKIIIMRQLTLLISESSPQGNQVNYNKIKSIRLSAKQFILKTVQKYMKLQTLSRLQIHVNVHLNAQEGMRLRLVVVGKSEVRARCVRLRLVHPRLKNLVFCVIFGVDAGLSAPDGDDGVVFDLGELADTATLISSGAELRGLDKETGTEHQEHGQSEEDLLHEFFDFSEQKFQDYKCWYTLALNQVQAISKNGSDKKRNHDQLRTYMSTSTFKIRAFGDSVQLQTVKLLSQHGVLLFALISPGSNNLKIGYSKGLRQHSPHLVSPSEKYLIFGQVQVEQHLPEAVENREEEFTQTRND